MAKPSPAPTGRKTTAQGKAHRAAALGPRAPKKPSPARATQNANPTDLPPGWVKTTLGEICDRVATIQPEADPDTEFTYFDIGGIDNETNRVVETKTVLGREVPSRARQSVRQGDILFSTVRTYLKKIAQIDKDYPNPVASTGFTVLRAPEGVSPQFLFRQILSDDFLKPVHDLQSGSSYPAVRDKDVFAQPIKLAPTAEQDRIVAKLDAMLFRQILDDLAEAMQEFQSAEDILLEDAEVETSTPTGIAAQGQVSIKPASKKIAARKIPARKVVAAKIPVKKTVRKITRNR